MESCASEFPERQIEKPRVRIHMARLKGIQISCRTWGMNQRNIAFLTRGW